MARRFSKAPWTVKFNRRRNWWEIHNGHKDPVAIIYTTEDDARLLAASLRMLSELKHAEAILRMHEGELRASAKATLARIRALIGELQ